MFIAVNFHYIGKEDGYPNGGIYPISEKRLANQIDELGKVFSFVSQDDLLFAIEGKKMLPEKSCLITFDDGLRCQYEKALPILDNKKISALFFVSSLPLSEKKVCAAHKIHFLMAKWGVDTFLLNVDKELQKNFSCNIDSFFNKETAQLALQKYRYDNEKSAKLKFLLNVILSQEAQLAIINNLFAGCCGSEKDFAENLYMSESQVKDLYQRGLLGLHSHNHYSLGLLDDSNLEKDISINKKTIEDIVGGAVKAIAYPFGADMDVGDRVVDTSKKLGLQLGFTMARQINQSLQKPMLLARFDTNDVAGGKKPLEYFKSL